jgi:hypothetical protein
MRLRQTIGLTRDERRELFRPELTADRLLCEERASRPAPRSTTHVLEHPAWGRSYTFTVSGPTVAVVEKRGGLVYRRTLPVVRARRMWAWLVKAHGYQTW